MEPRKRKALNLKRSLRQKESLMPESLQNDLPNEKQELNGESDKRYHRLETLVSNNSIKWSRGINGVRTKLNRLLDIEGILCYSGRQVVGWLDGTNWRKINPREILTFEGLLSSGAFVKIALLEEGKPSGEDSHENDESR